MLNKAKTLKGYKLDSLDGEFGEVEEPSYDESRIFVNLTREAIKASPEYTEEALISRDYEAGLYGHYRFAGYWAESGRHAEPVLPPG